LAPTAVRIIADRSALREAAVSAAGDLVAFHFDLQWVAAAEHRSHSVAVAHGRKQPRRHARHTRAEAGASLGPRGAAAPPPRHEQVTRMRLVADAIAELRSGRERDAPGAGLRSGSARCCGFDLDEEFGKSEPRDAEQRRRLANAAVRKPRAECGRGLAVCVHVGHVQV
jgi:hypothetical protein